MNFRRSLLLACSALLFLIPAVNLMWRGGSGYGFFLLLALALGAAMVNWRNPGYFSPLRDYRWYTVGMFALLVCIAVQQALFGYWMPREFDALARFPLALLIFLLLRQLPTRYLKTIGWGCVAGALVVGIWALLSQPPGGWSDKERLSNSFTNAIPFGDTALLLAFLSVFTRGWDDKRDWRTLALRLLALVSGGYVSFVSGTRGGWIAIPVFLVLLAAQYRCFTHKKRLVAMVLVLVPITAGLLSIKEVPQRMTDATRDIARMQQGDAQSSFGARRALWQASSNIFARHPIYGVGKGHLEAELDSMAKRGEVSPLVVNERAHSDFFSTLAEMGSVGVASLLLFYFGITVYFWRERRASDPTIRAASYAGLAVAFSTVIFGLSIDVLVPVMVTVLIALMVATLLAVIDARKRELAAQAAAACPGATQIDDISARSAAQCASTHGS
ncbi:O-antigen ligase family protein [Paraburkholderia acidiphila]|uniref:Polymerase n=1 Tax=Paraburkholderia acidiphila TaxID=2571747 RepID=A0A7Z2J760_9BURK|nr:O-antigen ligase family protein [Paraburkholderia acidiphila]QGZ54202.1 polymerase [Paraburkholderia acidiphila]